MKIHSWYSNGSLDAFYKFCSQNRCKTIWVKLRDRSELVKGILYKRNTQMKGDGVYILLNSSIIHPAYYCMEDIESIHAFLGEQDPRALVHPPITV